MKISKMYADLKQNELLSGNAVQLHIKVSTPSRGQPADKDQPQESLPEQWAVLWRLYQSLGTLPMSSLRSISAVVGWTMPSTLMEPMWLMSLWVRDSCIRKKG